MRSPKGVVLGLGKLFLCCEAEASLEENALTCGSCSGQDDAFDATE